MNFQWNFYSIFQSFFHLSSKTLWNHLNAPLTHWRLSNNIKRVARGTMVWEISTWQTKITSYVPSFIDRFHKFKIESFSPTHKHHKIPYNKNNKNKRPLVFQHLDQIITIDESKLYNHFNWCFCKAFSICTHLSTYKKILIQ